MQLIPAALVPAVRSFVQSQGGDPYLVNNDGSVNPTATVALFFNEVRVKTAVTPELVFPINAQGQAPDPLMQEVLDQLRPTVTLTGPAGTVIAAPYGMPQGQRSWWPVGLAVGGAVLFVGWALFGGRR